MVEGGGCARGAPETYANTRLSCPNIRESLINKYKVN